MQPSISVIIPAYNEASRILETIANIQIYLNKEGREYEIIVVDDGSTDLTGLAIQNEIRDQRVQYIAHGENKGKGAAIQTGVLAAKNNHILFTDADNATSIEGLEVLERAIENGADIAIGSRRKEGAIIKTPQPWYRVWIGKLGNLLIRIILGLPYKDTQCGFKLFTKEAAVHVFKDLQFPRWSFDYEILYRAKKDGLHVSEEPITWEDKAESKFNPVKDTIKCTIELVKIRKQIK